MHKNISSRISFIIGYRKSNSDRERSLNFVIGWLSAIFPEIEIIIVEQDQSPQLENQFSSNCKTFFIYNPGPYNRGWGFNYGAKQTDKEVLFFSDSDMFMSEANYLKCFEAALIHEAVCPEDVKQKNVKITNTKSFSFIDLEKDRTVYTFSGGLVLFNRKAFEKIGGWDENFEGWGAEDNALDHVIKQKLNAVQLYLETYHIDHERALFDGKKHPNYNKNLELSQQIEALQGKGLDNYVNENVRLFVQKGNPDKYKSQADIRFKKLTAEKTFVLAITTYNRLNYLKQLLESWKKTRNNNVTWKLIIADDGSDDGTIEFLESNFTGKPGMIVIKNERTGISHQFNTIVQILENEIFDMCFKCDDDILFLQKGWDELYYYATIESGYQHLIYYSLNWRLEHNRKAVKNNNLLNSCDPINVQGAFFTLTPDIIKKVGYMDTLNFGFMGKEHIDYSWRCCRAGFNELTSPFDVEHSNDFIELQMSNYTPSLEMLLYDKINSTIDFEKKKEIINGNRVYIAYQSNANESGYKYLNSLWREISYDMYNLIYKLFYRDCQLKKQNNIPSKNSIEFLNFINSLLSTSIDRIEQRNHLVIEKNDHRSEGNLNDNSFLLKRVQKLVEDNNWYKKELEDVTNYYKSEMDKITNWYESLSVGSFIKRKIQSKHRNNPVK